MGVRVTKSGRPVSYYLAEPANYGAYRFLTGKHTELPASEAIHIFEQIEPGQVRGIPWLASSLIDIANSRAFAKETIEAARSAALMNVIMTADNMDAEIKQPAQSTVSIPRRSMVYVKPGWKAQQVTPQHPSTRYIEFQHENYRAIGRPVGMPLLTILLDARYHNYSSARYDGQVYRRHLNAIQARLTRQRCNPCANQVLLDAERNGQIRRRPAKVSLVWGWSNPPEIDEEKTARANEIKLRMGAISLSEVCANSNRSLEEVVQQRVRDDELLESFGLPTVRESIAQPGQVTQLQADSEERPASGDRSLSDYFVRMGNYE